MKATIIAAVAAATLAAAYGLPGYVLVISDNDAGPDEAAGLYYLGSCAAGYLYNGSSAALGAVAPYQLLDRDAQAKDYYVVWAPEWVGITPEAFGHLGTAVRLSDAEILVGLEYGFGPGDLRAVEHRIELIKLEPVTPVEWKADAEAPTKKDPRIAAAVSTITAEEYAVYIKRLQDFKTRETNTPGCDAARDYIRNFFSSQNLDATLFGFECIGFDAGYYPEPRGNIYVKTDRATLWRSRDLGATWDVVTMQGVGYVSAFFWLNESYGFAIGYNNVLDPVLCKTHDGGVTWEIIKVRPGEPEMEYRPMALFFADPETGWLGGSVRKTPVFGMTPLKPFLLKTIDGGRTWKHQKVPQDIFPRGISFFDRRYGWASEVYGLGKLARIIYTADGGATWRECTRPTNTNDVGRFAVLGPREAWTTDGSRGLLHTTDGLTWNYVYPGVGQTFNRVEFPDPAHGYAAGPTLVATEDGGATWRDVDLEPAERYYAVLSFADKDRGVVGDRTGKFLFRTDNGCENFVNIKKGIDLSDANVVAERRGYGKPQEIVIIGGHYDSVAVDALNRAPGAEDNASGTACAMAAARAFRNVSFDRTVRYVAFGDEEYGLNGSGEYAEYCAAKGEKIVAVLNADMVSYDEESGARDDFSVACDENTWLFDYLKGVGNLYGNNLVYDSVEYISDQFSFWRAGYAALGVIEGAVGVGGVLNYPWYHTSEDTLDKLHPELGVRFVRDYAAMLAHLAGVADSLLEPTPPGAGTVPFSRAFAVYPNPYRYATTTGGVNFVGIKSPAKVDIYDLAGRRVASAAVAAPTDEFVWRPGGEALSPGVYLYRVQGRKQEESGKIVISK